MSITLKLVDLVDRLKIQQFFIEKEDKTYFLPLKFQINGEKIESTLDRMIKVKGRSYQMNDFEKQCLEELDF